jgi:hypothetical protein
LTTVPFFFGVVFEIVFFFFAVALAMFSSRLMKGKI